MVKTPAVWVANIHVDTLLCYPTSPPPPPSRDTCNVSRKILRFALDTNTAPPALILCRSPWEGPEMFTCLTDYPHYISKPVRSSLKTCKSNSLEAEYILKESLLHEFESGVA